MAQKKDNIDCWDEPETMVAMKTLKLEFEQQKFKIIELKMRNNFSRAIFISWYSHQLDLEEPNSQFRANLIDFWQSGEHQMMTWIMISWMSTFDDNLILNLKMCGDASQELREECQ